ncbi:MAG: glycoside hydrolase family 13 protein [Sarcina sp.]
MNSFYMLHNSQDEFFRNPFGAIKQGEIIKLYIELEHDANVKLCLINFDDSKEKVWMEKDYQRSSWKKNFYNASINTKDKIGIMNYYFEIEKENNILFYGNNLSCLGGVGQIYKSRPKEYQITIYEDFKVPDWYKEGIIYQVFVDRFYNGNEDGSVNNPKKNSFIYSSWDDDPLYIKDSDGKIIKWDFYGGNIKGVLKKLKYIKSLGVSIIYFNPIFKAKSCHKYDTADYEEIDEMFGNNNEFQEFCKSANEIGIKIILDGVFSHTGDDSKYFNKYGNYNTVGAAQSINSPYFEWYKFKKYPETYECWWGIENQPNVDEMNKDYIDYIIESENSIIVKWLRLGASGWRLDVADELPDNFIELIRSRMKMENKESLLVGEVWEDASNKISYNKKRKYLFGKELDSVTNYPLKNNIISFVKREITAIDFSKKIMNLYENYPKESFYSTMNILGNHDTNRILTNMKGDIRALKMATAIQFLMPGVPLIYYGDEVGMEGEQDPDNRKPFPWRFINTKIYSWYSEITHIRVIEDVVRHGEFKIHIIDEDVFCFERYLNQKKLLFFANQSNFEKFIKISFIKGIFKNYLNPYERYYFYDEGLNLKLETFSCKILVSILEN